MKTKKLVQIDYSDISNFPELAILLCIDLSEDIDIEMSDYWYDCDYVKVDGEVGEFITVEMDDIQFIIHNGYDSQAAEIIKWVYDNVRKTDYKREFIPVEDSWETWANVKTGVAYRGGVGYVYRLFVKELQVNSAS